MTPATAIRAVDGRGAVLEDFDAFDGTNGIELIATPPGSARAQLVGAKRRPLINTKCRWEYCEARSVPSRHHHCRANHRSWRCPRSPEAAWMSWGMLLTPVFWMSSAV